ncbi:MAG: GNAT family N-acetyltransferase [Aristaeellaceae bacterium]
MIRLEEITPSNFLSACRLHLDEQQQRFVAPPVGILARGYVYRHDRARVYAITAGDTVVGLTMVRDLNESPACYDLQQFMIGQAYQRRGYGREALQQLLALLRQEGRYDAVELCVHRDAQAARKLYMQAGFTDTGYTDASTPDCLTLRYPLR